MDKEGLCYSLLVFDIGSIKASMTPVEVEPVLKLFGGEIPDLSYVRRPVGAVDLLLVVHNAGLMPVVVDLERHRVGNLRLLTSIFGTRMLLDGVHPALRPSAMLKTKEAFDLSHSVMGGIKYELGQLRSSTLSSGRRRGSPSRSVRRLALPSPGSAAPVPTVSGAQFGLKS